MFWIHGIPVLFPEPIPVSADVVQCLVDSVVARRLPTLVLEE